MPGTGEGWLLLHGTPLTPAVWEPVAERLRRFGSVQAPDLSTAVDCPTGVSVQAALAARILEGLDPSPERLHVAGHSFGGQVAIEVALLAPPGLCGLTVVCSRDTPYPAFAPTAAGLRRGDPIDGEVALHRWFRPDELASASSLVDYARRCLRDADRATWARDLDAIAGYDRSGEVGRIAVPVTLVAAELDPVSTPAAMAALASRLPAARLRVLTGAAHLSPFARPERLVDLIRGGG